MYRPFFAVFVILCIFLPVFDGKTSAVSAQTLRTGFDCANVRNWSEKIICQDTRLARLHRQLSVTLEDLRLRLPDYAQVALTQEQDNWLAGRDGCREQSRDDGIRPDKCLSDYYQARIDALPARWGDVPRKNLSSLSAPLSSSPSPFSSEIKSSRETETAPMSLAAPLHKPEVSSVIEKNAPVNTHFELKDSFEDLVMRLSSQLRVYDIDNGLASRPAFWESQAAFEDYRAANCTWKRAMATGTGQEDLVDRQCYEALTRARHIELQRLLEQFSE